MSWAVVKRWTRPSRMIGWSSAMMIRVGTARGYQSRSDRNAHLDPGARLGRVQHERPAQRRDALTQRHRTAVLGIERRQVEIGRASCRERVEMTAGGE